MNVSLKRGPHVPTASGVEGRDTSASDDALRVGVGGGRQFCSEVESLASSSEL